MSPRTVLGNATENKKFRYGEHAQDHYGDCIQGLICSVPTHWRSGSRVEGECRCRSPQLGFYNLPTTRMYSLVGQPFGRQSDSPSDDVADSPSGGPSKLERKLGQPFGRTPKNRTK